MSKNMMARKYKLSDLHEQRVQVELQVAGTSAIIEGIAAFTDGELQISITDDAGDVTMILHEEIWNGDITDATDGVGFLIRLQQT
jgi:hypothetical protein